MYPFEQGMRFAFLPLVCVARAEPIATWPGLQTATTSTLTGVDMMNTDLDGLGGWRSFTASAETVTIHVSASEGSDSNDGLSPGTPVASLSHAITLLRDNHPDWLLLKRGDTWQENLESWSLKG